jgi:hypothetical protein
MGEKLKSTLLVTIHRRPENSQLGIQFVQKWLRKRPYALCKSNRGLGDLQLCYSLIGPLLFKIFEKNSFKQGQAKFKSGQPRPHVRRQARRRRRAPTCATAVPGTLAEAGLDPPVRAPWTPPLAPHRHPRPVSWPHVSRALWPRRADQAAGRPLASLPYPPYVAAVTVPMPLLGLQVGEREPPCKRRSPIKGSKPISRVSRAGTAAGAIDADVEFHLPTLDTTA